MSFDFDIYDVVLVSTLVDAELSHCRPCKCKYASKGACSSCDYRNRLFALKEKLNY